MLLDDVRLHASSVVANNAMNRERQLTGVNSYAKELGFDPLSRVPENGGAWLDVCCGSGRALRQAAQRVSGNVTLVGVDLVDVPTTDDVPTTGYVPAAGDVPGTEDVPVAGNLAGTEDVPAVGGVAGTAGVAGTRDVTFIAAAIEHWEPERAFDLITCVHGLHYVGDKLGVLARLLKWLTPTGTFVADLDLASVKMSGGANVRAELRAAGIGYDARKRRITCTGPRDLDLPYRYLGADDRAGPNYTGQPAVNSYYEER